MEAKGNIWTFGYGSLVWRPNFAFVSRKLALIKGWKRRFWQGSTDHRGVPGAPGRVVTLIPSENDHVWGMCYEIEAHNVADVLAYLDYREKGGYTRAEVDVYDGVGSSAPILRNVLLYTATETNENFLGPADEKDIAKQIFSSVGPSGKNVEYLKELAEELRRLDVVDEHIELIYKHVQELEEQIKAFPGEPTN